MPTPPLYVQDLPEPQLDAETRAAFDLAYQNIAAFHRAQQVGGAAHLLPFLLPEWGGRLLQSKVVDGHFTTSQQIATCFAITCAFAVLHQLTVPQSLGA